VPLHDWSELGGWEGMHLLWSAELLHDLKPRLPEGYRAYLGSSPILAVGSPAGKPDLSVRTWQPDNPRLPSNPTYAAFDAPDVEVSVSAIEPSTALLVEHHGSLVAAVELVSPRNKDRPTSRDTYLSRYLGYLLNGANLVLIDVHPRPAGFSFADRLTEELSLDRQPPWPAPFAISYRVGEPAATGGRLLAIWRRPFVVGQNLPSIPLPLTVEVAVPLNLELTYAQAAEDSYLE
jgi:hypothetical protein